VDRESVASGAKVLEAMGLRVRLGARSSGGTATFAGAMRRAAADLADMLSDDEVRAVHFARGGWGTSRFLETIDWRRPAAPPKLLVGTATSPRCSPRRSIARASPRVRPSRDRDRTRGRLGSPSLERAYFRPTEPWTLGVRARDVLAPGQASGRAAGGCLTLLAHLAGTPSRRRLRGRILLLEEIQEPPVPARSHDDAAAGSRVFSTACAASSSEV
jgi:muramoyltetrapeptide carboxypeptidase